MPGLTTAAPWGVLPDGRTVSLFTLSNSRGFRADISDLGGLLVRLMVPDRHGVAEDVTLGFDTLEEYLRPGHSPYFGCLVGRVGNRIAKGHFSLEGRDYPLATNNTPGGFPCHLHGGMVGFDKVLWGAEPFADTGAQGLRLTYHSLAGEEGYPGNLDVVVEYRLTEDGDLGVRYQATTDAATPINMTHHAYFNLAGSGDILGHELRLAAQEMVPVDAGLIPLGHLAPVVGTPFDFRGLRRIGDAIDVPDPQLVAGGGYDHTWVLEGPAGVLRPVGLLRDPASGRALELLTTEPGVQVYSGNFIPEGLPGKGGQRYGRRQGICLETQHFPDAPNQPAFPSIILQPGHTYQSETIFRFRAS